MALMPASLPNKTDRPAGPAEAQQRRAWVATLVVLCGVLGAMLGLSVKTQQAILHRGLIADRSGSAVLIKEVLDLQRQITELRAQNDALVKVVPTDSPQIGVLTKDLSNANFLAGLTDVKGPGVIVTLNDSRNPFPAGLQLGAPPNIIHDTDIGLVVNELKAAGAEAISVNGQRLVAVSPIRCAGPTIFINQTPQTPPYVIKAIGEPKTLATALNISGGIASQMQAFDKAMFSVQAAKQPLVISAYSGAIEPKYAVPVVARIASADKK